MLTIDAQTEKYDHFESILNKRDRQLIFASEANSLFWGGINLVSKIAGISKQACYFGKLQ